MQVLMFAAKVAEKGNHHPQRVTGTTATRFSVHFSCVALKRPCSHVLKRPVKDASELSERLRKALSMSLICLLQEGFLIAGSGHAKSTREQQFLQEQSPVEYRSRVRSIGC